MAQPIKLVLACLLTWSTAAFEASAGETQLALLASPVRTDGLPDTHELERRGARIGRIQVIVDDVFGEQNLAAPYRFADSLHISTKNETVLHQLLFRSGDAFDDRVLAESARLLREQRYFNDAAIEPVHYNEDNTVDVLVRVHDVWTLSPGFSFGRKGGENSARIKFEDTNFLGLGKQMSLERSSDVDRTAWRLAYADPNVFGSRWKLSTAYASGSDGNERAFAIGRPFYALDSHWSTDLGVADVTSAVSRYSLGQVTEKIEMRERALNLGGGFSHGLKDGWTRRLLGGFKHDSRQFAALEEEPTATVPEDLVLAYPWIGVEAIEDNYVSTRNLDQIGRTEDLYLGRGGRIEVGLASTAFGSTRDSLVLQGSVQAGADLGRERYSFNTIKLSGRLEGGSLADGLLEFNTRYYLRHSPRRVFFASASGTLTANLDPEEQLLLGGDNGLRGYPLRYQAGTASALVTLEERFYTNWQPLKLVNVGAAVFMDVGRTWGHDDYAAPPDGWLADIGFGLRLGSARSGLGNVLHIDLAFPLSASNEIDQVQLLIETRKSF